jgi:hypothetical protein
MNVFFCLKPAEVSYGFNPVGFSRFTRMLAAFAVKFMKFVWIVSLAALHHI